MVVAALLLDMDGTLVDSMPLHLAAWQQTALEFGGLFDFVDAPVRSRFFIERFEPRFGRARGVEEDAIKHLGTFFPYAASVGHVGVGVGDTLLFQVVTEAEKTFP